MKRTLGFLVAVLLLAALLLSGPGAAGSMGATPDTQGLTKEYGAEDVSMSGWFSIVWGDSVDGEGAIVYTLTDETGKHTLLEVDQAVAKRLGGVLQFNGKFVTVQGASVDHDKLEVGGGSSALLNVSSISAGGRTGLKAQTAGDVAASAVTGSHPWVTIMCKFSDVEALPQNWDFFFGMYADTQPGLNHYWQEVSLGAVNIDGSTVAGTGWYEIGELEKYNPDSCSGCADLDLLLEDCIAAADPDVDFTQFTGINMMFNFDFDYGWAWGGSRTLTLDGETRVWSVTWEPPWAYEDISVIAHEMGHGFGLPHSSYNRANVYDNAWDVMSWDRYNRDAATDPIYGCMGQHTISYHKDLLGWIPSERKITVEDGSIVTITLEDLAAPASANYQMVTIPIGGLATNFYTVEARLFTGYDVKLPGEAVIIHNVDTTERIPAVLVPGGLSSTHPDVRFTAGEAFVDEANRIIVQVHSATATGFEVTILHGYLPPTADAGGPYVTHEGTAVTLDAGASSHPDDHALQYRWDFENDGTWNTGWLDAPTYSYTPIDDFVGKVAVEVSDGTLSDTATADITVHNVAPTVTAEGDVINENDFATVSGTIYDPGILDYFTVVIDWGDGFTDSYSYPAGTTEYSETHKYLDDGDSGEPTWDYNVTVTVTDKDGGVGIAETIVTVNNVDPVVEEPYIAGQPNDQFILPVVHGVQFEAAFTDVGTLDTHTAVWDWGDGTTSDGVVIQGSSSGTATGSHTYVLPGHYTVTVTVTDDDTGSDSNTMTVHVADVDEALDDLNQYIQDLEGSFLRGRAAQRKNALGNMISALQHKWLEQEYNGMIQDLRNSIRSRADGYVDGRLNDDWILYEEAQQHICQKIDDITAYLEYLLSI